MTFVDLPAAVSVFIDANTFIYHFGPDPLFGPACQQLLKRIANQEIAGFTSTHVLSDVAHRLMTVEAIKLFGWPVAGIAARLRTNHLEIPKLRRYQQAIVQVTHFGIHVLPVFDSLVLAAGTLSQRHELLSGDALIVAVMQQHTLTHLASHDADFDRVPGLTRYAPV
jgi:predicted nucleic acid-binding protein